MGTVKLLSYPVYALATDERYLVTSGGGGGKEYGISDRIEFYAISEHNRRTELSLEASTSDRLGILDSADYLAERNLWIGSFNEGTVFFSYRPGQGLRVYGRVLMAKTKKDPRQTAARFCGKGDLFITGDSSCVVRVWRLSRKMLGMLSECEGSANSPEPPVRGYTDDYAPSDPAHSDTDALDDEETPSTNEVFSDDGSASSSVDSGAADRETDTEEGPVDSRDTDSTADLEPSVPLVGRALKRNVAVKVLEYNCHSHEISDCQLCSDGRVAVSVCSEYLVLYQLDPAKLLCKHRSAMRFKFCRFINSQCKGDSYRLLTVEWSCKKPTRSVARVWSYTLGSDALDLVKSVDVGVEPCSVMCVRRDDMYFALGFGTGEVAVYHTDTMLAVMHEHRHMLPVTDVTFLHDKLVSSGADFYVIIKEFQCRYLLVLLSLVIPLFAYLLYALTRRLS